MKDLGIEKMHPQCKNGVREKTHRDEELINWKKEWDPKRERER